MVSSREKMTIGLGMIAAAGIVVFMLTLPQFDAIQASLTQQKQLDTEVQGLTARQTILTTEVNNLRASGGNNNAQTTATVRTVSNDEKDAAVKEILDNVIKQATTNGNKLIELKPDDTIAQQQNNTEQLKNSALNKLNTDPTIDNLTEQEKRALATADPTNLTENQKAGYDAALTYVRNNPLPYEARYQIAFRGTFPSLEGFLQAIMLLDDVVELRDIELLNEAGADRSGTDPAIQGEDVLFDPAKPIRLTSNMTIYLDVR